MSRAKFFSTMLSWRTARVAIAITLLAGLLLAERDPHARLLPLDSATLLGAAQTTTTTTTTTVAAPLDFSAPVTISTTTCTLTSTISSNFNSTTIAATNRSIWFNAVGKFKNVPTNTKTTLFITGQQITFPTGGPVSLPDTKVVFDNTVTTASTTFAANMWTTTVPATYTGNVFIGGGFVPSSSGPPAGSNPVKWTATFALAPGVTVDGWKWAAAVYPGSPTNTGAGAKPVDGNNPASVPAANNSDHAGTPEAVKTTVVGGARGGGGSNYTGSYSGTAKIACSTAKGETLLYYAGSTPPQPSGGTSTTVYYADDSAIGATTVSFDGGAPITPTVAPSSVQPLTPLVVIGGSVSTTKNEQSITFTPPVGTTSVTLTVNDSDGDLQSFTWSL